MSFFEELPSPTEPPDDETPERRLPEWHGPPTAVIGGVVPVAEAVVRTSNVFVGLASVTAYPSGLSMSVVVAARRGELNRDDWEALEVSLSGSRLHSRLGSANSGAFRIGVELADGRRTAAVEHFRDVGDSEPDPPVLHQHGGGGSGRPGWMERRLEHVPELVTKARGANDRVLLTERAGQGCAIGSALFERIHQPYAREGQRAELSASGTPAPWPWPAP